MPCDYRKYPKNWKSEIIPRIKERDGHKCKFCGLGNYSVGWRDSRGEFHKIEQSMQGETDAMDALLDGYKPIKIVLTIAHLDHDTTNNEDSNLAALCQKCHLNYDKEFHRANAKATIKKKKGLQELF